MIDKNPRLIQKTLFMADLIPLQSVYFIHYLKIAQCKELAFNSPWNLIFIITYTIYLPNASFTYRFITRMWHDAGSTKWSWESRHWKQALQVNFIRIQSLQ